MTAPDPRVGEIEARLAECRPCESDCCGSTECQTERDAIYLLAELRKVHEALARVEEVHQPRQFNPISDGVYFGQTEFDHNICAHDHERWPCPTMEALRAAVAAANGDGQ